MDFLSDGTKKSGRCTEVLNKSQCMDFLSGGMKKSGRCREVLNKSQCMDFLSDRTKKSGRCREMAVSRGSTVFAPIEHRYHYDCLSPRFLLLRSTATTSYHNEEQKVEASRSKRGRPYIAFHQYLITKGRDK